MSVMASIILLLVFLIAYMAIIEIFTVLFRLTGLSYEKARTQVISMLTNSGFTTSESEIIMASKKRRKLARITMLSGYSFTVIIVSVIVNMFLALNQSELHQMLPVVLAVIAMVIVLLLLKRIKAVHTGFDHLIEILGNRIMFGKASNAVVLVDNYRSKAIVEIYLEVLPKPLDGIPFADAQLKKTYDIQVLLIKRGGMTISDIDGETRLHTKDTAILFGDYKNIKNLFEHPNSNI